MSWLIARGKRPLGFCGIVGASVDSREGAFWTRTSWMLNGRVSWDWTWRMRHRRSPGMALVCFFLR